MVSKVARVASQAMKRGRFAIFAIWFIVACCGLKWGRKFTSATTVGPEKNTRTLAHTHARARVFTLTLTLTHTC